MKDQIGSLGKAAQVLRALAISGKSGASVAELAERAEIARPSVHRVCLKLQEIGWVEKDPETRKLHLGPELAALGLVAQHRFPLEVLAKPYLEELSQKTGQAVSLLARIGNEVVCVARIEGSGQVRTLLMEVGSRWPLGYGAAGMAVLAALPKEEGDELFQQVAPLIANETEDALRERLDRARAHGYAEHVGLVLAGISGIAAPIYDRSGTPIASVSMAYAEDWMSPEERDMCRHGIPRLAQSLSQRLKDGS